MLGHIVNDEFVPLTVTDTAGGRKLEQVGCLNADGWFLTLHADYGPDELAMVERMGYTEPVFREVS